jgi:hypothetical protein
MKKHRAHETEDPRPDQHDRKRKRRFSEAWDEFRREIDLAALNLDPDEVFSSVRDHSPGRDTIDCGESSSTDRRSAPRKTTS